VGEWEKKSEENPDLLSNWADVKAKIRINVILHGIVSEAYDNILTAIDHMVNKKMA